MSIRDYCIKCTTPEEFLKAKKALHKMGEPVYNVDDYSFVSGLPVYWVNYKYGLWRGKIIGRPRGKEEILAQEFIDE